LLVVAFDIMLAGSVVPMFAAVYWKSSNPNPNPNPNPHPHPHPNPNSNPNPNPNPNPKPSPNPNPKPSPNQVYWKSCKPLAAWVSMVGGSLQP